MVFFVFCTAVRVHVQPFIGPKTYLHKKQIMIDLSPEDNKIN